mgnify:CR=1 FL=1
MRGGVPSISSGVDLRINYKRRSRPRGAFFLSASYSVLQENIVNKYEAASFEGRPRNHLKGVTPWAADAQKQSRPRLLAS